MRLPFLRTYSAFSARRQPVTSEPAAPNMADLEKNEGSTSNSPTTSHPPFREGIARSLTFPHHVHDSAPDEPLPPDLIKFQNLTGISIPPSIRSRQPHRPAQNLGIYKRVCDHESKVKFQHKLSMNTLNVCFLLQIILGAALTALGAAGGPSGAVTVLGAMNTILAGLLTYLKGQGLPQRLDQQFNLLRTLREHIEARERDFSEPSCSLDVDREVEIIIEMYKEIRQSAQDNQPGNVLPPRGNMAALMKQAQGAGHENTSSTTGGTAAAGPMKAILTGLKDVKEKYDASKHAQQDVQGKSKEIVENVEKKAQGALDSIEEEKRRASTTFEKMEEELSATLQRVAREKEKALKDLENLGGRS